MKNKTTENSNDFSLLLKDYASKEEISLFQKGLTSHPISGLLRNPNVFPSDYFSSLEGLKKDKEDPLLYRFDKETDKWGSSLAHFSGGFYILDPSSATISYYLAPLLKKDPLVLDLCAAPGGKSIALSFRRKDALILSNDIAYKRAIEIQKNVDRLGLTNVLSLSMDPMNLNLGPMFDSILLDVPCSGSGMIRKEEKMKEDYSEEKVERLLPIQKNLLEKSYSLLKGDGILAYSTCSLSIKEDENQIQEFLKNHPDMEIIPISKKEGMLDGVHQIGYHLVPGIFQGEGIYFVLLRKNSSEKQEAKEIRYKNSISISSHHVISYRKNEYVVDRMYDEITSLPYLSPGLKIHDDSPHPKCPFDHAYSKVATDIPLLPVSEEEGILYASGNEINGKNEGKDGLCILTYQGARLGFGKKVSSRIKNYLPKGLRANLIQEKRLPKES